MLDTDEYDNGPYWDHRFLRLAKNISEWSKDPSTKVGAIIVRPNKSVCSLGFNGFARGVKDYEERYANRELKYKLIVHAEMNAKNFAYESLEGYTLYTYPFLPCSRCASSMIQAGIFRIVSIRCAVDRWKDSIGHGLLQFREACKVVKVYDHLPGV